MANVRLKLLLCLLGIAALVVHVPFTWARQPESNGVAHRAFLHESEKQLSEKGGEGEEGKHEEGGEGEKHGEGEGEEEEKEGVSSGNVSTSFTLIGSFTFLISLLFAMNHPDPEMKEYAYTVISSTVSIFSAVLMFQSLNGLIETFIIDTPIVKNNRWLEFLVDALHMMTWYATTQLVIAKVTRAFETDQWRDEKLADHKTRKKVQKEVKVERICWGIIFAHLTGFASINFWSNMQSMFFSENWVMSLVPIPIAVLGQLGLQTGTDMFREYWAAGDGKKDWFEENWDMACEEAEDDILGLTMSVLIVSSCRFAINEAFDFKCLSNAEQKEEDEACEDLDKWRTDGQHFSPTLILYFIGFVFVTALFISKLLFAKYLPEEEEMMEELDADDVDEAEEIEEAKGDKKEHTMMEERIKRIGEVWLISLSMSFSWCIFHGTTQLLRSLWPGYLGEEANATTLAVILALSVTYIAFLFIRGLDKIADLPDEYTPPAVDDAIRQVIKAMSLFIGFAWEQTFDESVDALASKFASPAIAKLVIGTLCIVIVFVAWKWYILPTVVQQGWKLGYTEGKGALMASLKFLKETEKDESHVYEKLMVDLHKHSTRRSIMGGDSTSGLSSIDLRGFSSAMSIGESSPVGYQWLPGDDRFELLEQENKELRERNEELHKALCDAENNLKDMQKSEDLLTAAALSLQKTQELMQSPR